MKATDEPRYEVRHERACANGTGRWIYAKEPTGELVTQLHSICCYYRVSWIRFYEDASADEVENAQQVVGQRSEDIDWTGCAG